MATVPFATHEDEHGFVYMKLSSPLNDANFPELLQNVEGAKQIVHTMYTAKGEMLRCLFDISEFDGTYNVGAMTTMMDLEKHNRPMIQKTAIFGGSAAARIATELTVTMIGIPTIKMFETHEQAVEWLKK